MIGPAQRTALRLGAVACLVGALVLGGFALLGGPGDGARAAEVRAVADPEAVELPDSGLLGSEVVVYGASDAPAVRPAELGCRLLSRSGRELSAAQMSHLAVLRTEPVVLDGEQLQPLFAVREWTDGAQVSCNGAGSVEPLALSAPSTFGGLEGAVRVFAAGSAVLLLLLGTAGLVLLRPRRRG